MSSTDGPILASPVINSSIITRPITNAVVAEARRAGEVVPFRVLPMLLSDNTFFWTSGSDGQLRFMRCTACNYIVHTPSDWCPKCVTRTTAPAVVSGRAALHTYTINYQPWIPGSEPYIIAVVAIEEQDDVRLTTNIVDCHPDELQIGMALEVVFEQQGDVFLPLFRPEGGGR